METPALPRQLALTAGCHQLINWGISFYMPGTFALAISADRGWSSPQIYLGLTLAMLVMAAASPFVAHLLARFGGQRVVMSGTLLIAAGCAGMAYTQTLFGWYCVWLITGIGMRLSLYDALFAALVNLYGQQARRTISRVTLAGGLASAVFWPLGDGLLHLMSWQEALRVYALFGLLSAALIRSLPRQRLTVTTKVTAPPLRNERRNGWLYAAFIALFTFVSSGTSTHLPEFIASFGLPVTIGILWGIGQTGARSLEVLAGARLTPFKLTLFTTLAMPVCFLIGLSSTRFAWCAAGFVLGFGAINGLMTIVKANLPLELFSVESYARRTGMLLIPGQLTAAASPFACAWLNKTLGIAGTMWVSTGLTLVIAGLAIAIVRRPGRQTVTHCIQRTTQTNGYKTPPQANITDT
ncbi:MFS transporter [Enterobacter kobei]|uniref:MFS transporter n=1 Tax=Enterobacter kobei TaxID=208224 RepID=UPI001ABE17EE|nr:MFS transporter [Enterobacter kobei]MBO4157263.1 MFS transporter [Enterobacter kobei]MCK7362446.1 MFS transporter [Enterobacter kobei]HDW1094320.1 MFS transporter [Enterobacter kobei]HED5667824.1 MFS transporter [Enterobacter kobei]HEG2023043.1 MFS transporter [Enterobacter kobei]